jgi:DNA-binding transcriptional MocR family regulator
MVVRQQESEEALHQLFRALADGTRRDILARSLTETPSVSDLAARYEMSFAAVQKHVAVLERAGLIQTGPKGATWSGSWKFNAENPISSFEAHDGDDNADDPNGPRRVPIVSDISSPARAASAPRPS